MSGGGTSTSISQNNAQNNLQFQNTGTISVGGNISNGNTTQNGGASSVGGGIDFSAHVTLPSAPTAPTAPSALLIELKHVDCNHLTQKGGVIDGSLFNFGDINNHQAGVLAFADTGKNLLCAGHVSNSGTAYFGMI